MSGAENAGKRIGTQDGNNREPEIMTLYDRRAVLPMLAATPLLTAGCESGAAASRTIYVLLDVSGTYFRELNQCIDGIKRLVGALNPLDAMVLARIGTCSFSDRSILLRFRLPDRPTAAAQAKRTIASDLDGIARREQMTNYTDIVGAVYQAAAELGSSSARRRYLVMYTDLVQDLAPNCRAGRRDLPDMSGITVIAANVITRGNADPQTYFDRVKSWEERFRDAGAQDWIVERDPAGVARILRGF